MVIKRQCSKDWWSPKCKFEFNVWATGDAWFHVAYWYDSSRGNRPTGRFFCPSNEPDYDEYPSVSDYDDFEYGDCTLFYHG